MPKFSNQQENVVDATFHVKTVDGKKPKSPIPITVQYLDVYGKPKVTYLPDFETESESEAQPIESGPSYDSNPIPVKSKWINSGYDLMAHVFGASGFIKSADYRLSNVLEDFFVVGKIKVKPASNIVTVPVDKRNVIQDAIRCYNVVTLFKDLKK